MNFKKPQFLFLSMFGAGLFPKAPGTFASLLSLLPLYALCYFNISITAFTTALLLITIISCILTEQIQKIYNVHDPSWIVIDEFIGIILFYPFIHQPNLVNFLLIFILFRFFDIFKIWPASYFDRLKNGYGVIVDDIIASIYAIIVYKFIVYIFLNFN